MNEIITRDSLVMDEINIKIILRVCFTHRIINKTRHNHFRIQENKFFYNADMNEHN